MCIRDSAKNHDYDEAWRSMRVSSYTDLILMKIYRTKQIESLAGNTSVSYTHLPFGTYDRKRDQPFRTSY